MPFRRVMGTKVSVDLGADVRSTVDAPLVSVYDPARLYFKLMALRLLAVTGLTDPVQLKAVTDAAATLADTDDRDWTTADGQKLLAGVGAVQLPSHVAVWRLPGQATLLFKAVLPETSKARRLNYPKGEPRPQISVLAALRPEGIVIPEGMCMEVPVKLMEDEGGALVLAAFFRRGRLRNVTEEPEDAGKQAAAGADKKK